MRHQLGPVHSPLRTRRGKFAYPHETATRKEKRLEDLDYASLGNGQLRRYVSSDGRLYFGYGRFISPNNLADRAVFAAFLIASEELSQLTTMHSNLHDGFEAVISLQCISLAGLQFCYYFVDHDHHRVSDPLIFMSDGIGACNDDKKCIIGYWEHLALFSTHNLCTPIDYKIAQGLLAELQSQQLTSLATRDDDTPGGTEILCNMLSRFDPFRIDTHATASIARVMKWILVDPPAPKPRGTAWPSILRSLRGIIFMHPDDRDENEESETRDAHPLVHGDSLDSDAVLNETM
ncbi:hypothetical protein BN14_07744 [Rhizoctonia solani AG-1 IB]|uniref:Uncharacterized protein n=1 Tax=Thanatephorus cucumeris (strain AG1-IB / isolate 7/3/14) TaxID=1108050 RepID=M5C2U1_THACB|nr:hypothetical protein BN14_07744 [Rhizoctonia solani AG-1 IB]